MTRRKAAYSRGSSSSADAFSRINRVLLHIRGGIPHRDLSALELTLSQR
jgi:hypothetical protein